MGTAAYSIEGLRIAPVCDTADTVLIIPPQGESIRISRHQYATFDEFLDALKAYGVDTLICGALSKELQYTFAAHEINVLPFMCGPVREVMQSYQSGESLTDRYAMPGCRRCRGGRQGRTRRQRHARI